MQRRRDIIADIGCIICLREGVRESPCAWHHIDGQKSQAKHKLTIGLCYNHHSAGLFSQRCVSRHPYKTMFQTKYGTEQELLEYQNRLIKEYEAQI